MKTPWDDVITTAKVLELYDECMKRGGLSSPPSDGCVEGSLGNAWQAELYRQDEKEGVRLGLLFAVYLYYYLNKNHCFADGNKRIAWACLIYVFRSHGVGIDATDDEAVDVTEKVAKSELSIDYVIEWVSDRLVEP